MAFTFSNREVKAMEDEESCPGMTRRELLIIFFNSLNINIFSVSSVVIS